jgi:uncharacterized protein YkwD
MTRGLVYSSLATCHLSLLALAPTAPATDNFDSIREAFLQEINGARREATLPLLRLSPKLSLLAQRRAAEIAGGGLESGPSAAEADMRAAAKAGYEAWFLAEVSVVADGNIPSVFSQASAPGGPLDEEIRRFELRDLGVGVAIRDETPLYVFLLGLSWEDFDSGKRKELGDLEQVRRALLQRVNQIRSRAGLPPLREEPLLDETAQRHAADMLARSYYGHETPEGDTVLERSTAAGYRARSIAENIARGPYTIADVMDGWMASSTHREHLLSPVFADIGSGLAVGKNANGYQIIWVQCFGRSKEGVPQRRRR